MKKPRVYIDTSVIGGCLDAEFESDSRKLLELARIGEITFVLSDVVAQELDLAPAEVRELFAELSNLDTENVIANEQTEALRDAYIRNNVLGRASQADAHHVAIATVFGATMIVSWNFKHIVHHEKMRGFNAVNLLEGYGTIEIHSPKEVA